jgi:hypothetical protein
MWRSCWGQVVAPSSSAVRNERKVDPVRNRIEIILAVSIVFLGVSPGLANADDPVGSCCGPDGSCTVTTQAACPAESGPWWWEGGTCEPNPCQPLHAAFVLRPPALSDPYGPGSVVAGDFNKDDHLDLAVNNHQAPTVSIFLGNGDGTFRPPTDYPCVNNSWTIESADLDHDGNTDLIVSEGSAIAVLLGRGDGTFGPPHEYPLLGNLARESALGDLDGDGNLDAVVDQDMGAGSGAYSIFTGNGDGTFSDADTLVDTIGGAPALADLNGDGKLDLVIGGAWWTNTLHIYLGQGDGTFSGPDTLEAADNFPLYPALADVNNDTNVDIIVPTIYADSVGVFLGNGDGTFQIRSDFPTAPSPVVPILADLRLEGHLDLMTINQGHSNSLSVLLGAGTDTLFRAPTNLGLGEYPGRPALGDFNEDDCPDLAIPCQTSDYVLVMLNAICPTSGVGTQLPYGALHWLAASPNPSHGNVKLVYDIGTDRPETVRISAYDISGRLVRSLVDAPEASGPHALTWAGEDSQGRQIGSGVYFVRAVLGGRTYSTRVVIMR